MEKPDDALLCPITLEVFRDPVVAQDGHTYERKAIEEWVQKNGTSPITNQQISLENLVPNYAVKKMVDHFETSIRNKNFQYTLDVDVKKKKGRPLFQTYGKTIYHAEWLPTNKGRPEIILLKIDGARANKEASFYVDLSRHAHIVRTFGLVCEDDDDRNSITLLQEYAAEGSLYELLTERKKPLDEKLLIEIFLQIIDAMSYLALNNVVHGDLACRNVLVFRFDEKDSRKIVVKITDFGLSRYSKIYSQAATVARTTLNFIPTRYSAPEILSTDVTANAYTEKSDIYSMGVLMWEAYSRGAIPWANEKDEDVVRRVRNSDTLPQPTNCSPRYWDIIIKTWAKLPNQRPTFDQLKSLFRHQIYQTSKSVSEQKLPSFYQGPDSSSFRQSNSLAGATGGAGVVKENDQMNLVGQQIQIDKLNCYVKGRVSCGDEELYGLESDKPITGYDGLCPKCRRNHVAFIKPSQGFYASVKNIHDKIHNETLSNERLKGRKEDKELRTVKDNLPPLDQPLTGKNKGIEGDSNSCYMDATIYCMFAYNNVFDSLLHMDPKTEVLHRLQKMLRENIVNVLRSSKYGFVDRHTLFRFRTQLSEATGDQSFKEMEKDPSEFLRALETLFHFAPLKTIPFDQPPNENKSNITTNIIWEMFDANPPNLLKTNIASIFRNSLTEIRAKLASIPPFLVLVAPRHARSQRSYRYIIPDRQITLDNDIVQLVCLKCKKTNHDSETPIDFFSCDVCYSNESSSLLSSSKIDATVACYCGSCISRSHKNISGDVLNHNTKKIQINKHKFNLFAVLCIEACHNIAFVKCQKQRQEHKWLFFDSMSDRVYDEQNISLVDSVDNFDEWIETAEKEDKFFTDLDRRRNQGKPTSQVFNENGMRQLRLFRDGAFFFYENSSVYYH